MNQDDFRQLISGQNAGLGAALLRLLLGTAAVGYWIIVRLRNSLYSAGLLKIQKVEATVISVGNITTGGAGKTPLVIWLCKYLQQDKVPCTILTRGYKATQDTRLKTQDQVDEPGILADSCPQAKVIVNPDRVAGANEAIEEFGAKVLVMDDGFQHRRLGRDLDIVTIDATRPFGYGKLLPAGLLRESVDSLKRADAVVITRSNQVNESALNKIETKIQKIKPGMIIARSIHSPVCAQTIDDKEIGLEKLRGKKIFAFCGIGNPEAFFSTIKTLGADLVGYKIYNDHYHYTDDCLVKICEQARGVKADLILTTQKDWSKIIGEWHGLLAHEKHGQDGLATSNFKMSIPLAYLEIELKLVSGEDVIRRLIKEALASKIAKIQ